MKKLKALGIVSLLTFVSIFAMGAKIGDDDLRVGVKTGADVTIQMGNGRLIWNDSGSKLQFSNDFGASVKDFGSGAGGAAGVNLLENADFESGSPPINWTASGGSFLADQVNNGFDGQSGVFNSSAAAQNLDSDAQTIPQGLENRTCNSTLQVKYVAGSPGDYKFQVIGSVAGLIAEKDISVNADWVKEALQYTCPSGQDLTLRVTSTADAGDVIVDNASLGKTDFVDISQAELVAHAFYPETALCDWLVDSATFADFAADSDCPPITVVSSSQAVNTADDDLPNIVFDDLRKGIYLVQTTYNVQHAVLNATFSTRIFDGTTGNNRCGGLNDPANGQRQVSCSEVFVHAGGAKTFRMQGLEDQTGALDLRNNTTAGILTWTVTKYPEASAEAITLETVGEHWDVNLGGANPDMLSGTVADYAELVNGSLDMVINTSKGSKTAQIPCALTQPSSGLVCGGPGNETVGIVIDISSAGLYEACVAMSHNIGGSSGGGVAAQFQWIETPNNAQDNLQLGGEISSSTHTNSNASGTQVSNQIRNCAQFTFASAGQKTLRVMFEQSTAATLTSNVIEADRSAGSGQRDIHITVRKLNQQMPTPVFPEILAKINGTESGLRLERTKAATSASCTGSPCAIDSGNLCSTVTRSGAGVYTCNFATAFTIVPVCSFETASVDTADNTITTTTASYTTAGADVSRHSILCFGK